MTTRFKVKIHKIRSTLATVGLLLVFLLVGAALGLAQDGLPAGSVAAPGWHCALPVKTAPVDDRYTLRIGLSVETGTGPVFFERTANGNPVLALRFCGARSPAVPGNPIARKVSLHLLDSIFLI